MWKKILFSIILIIIFIGGIEFFYVSKREKMNDTKNIVENETELSRKYVKDECLNEWEDYSKTVQNEIMETSQSLNDENRPYILREKDGFINVYYINESGEEILYRVTDISVKFLGEDDIKELKQGIEVIGTQKLNEMLEDFE